METIQPSINGRKPRTISSLAFFSLSFSIFFICENTYKIRLAVKSKGKGKSGGLRIITHVFEIEIEVAENEKEQRTTIVLVAIYDKSEMENLPDKELRELIEDIEDELSGEKN